MKLYLIFQLTIGVVGLFFLRRKLQWNNSQFRVFSILFLFSPIIMQHTAVAYFTWYNFYFFPWMIYFAAERNMIKGLVGVGAVLGLVVLQGGIYIVQYLGMFYILYELLHVLLEKDWNRVIRIALVPIIAGALSFVRFSTTAIVYGEYIRPWVEIDGYNLPFFLFYAIIPTITIPPINLFFHTDYLGWQLTPHDSGIFWGLSLIMLIVVVVKYREVVKDPNSKDQNGLNYNAVFIAATFLFIISFYKVWYYMMKAASVLEVPFFESIKNHGIRFVMGAFFGYALLFATYSDEIWDRLRIFTQTKFWTKLKSVLSIIVKIIIALLGMSILVLRVFKTRIADWSYRIITQAYDGTAYSWLREYMEGMTINPLELYYTRFDVLYGALVKWSTSVFIVLIVLYLITQLWGMIKKRFELFLRSFSYFKFEMLLAIPLIFSTVMWANLAASVPFSSHETTPVSPPIIEILTLETGIDNPEIEVTPKELKLIQKGYAAADEYVFTKISANDSKYLEIKSGNASFSDKNGRLSLIPYDTNPVKIVFRNEKVLRPLYITIILWSFVLLYAILNIKVLRKR